MKRIIVPLLCIAALLGSGSVLGNADVDRAVQALGGRDALAAVRSVQIRGTVKHWEPDQSVVPGGEKRFAGESGFTLTRDFTSGAVRIDWQRRSAIRRYPLARAGNDPPPRLVHWPWVTTTGKRGDDGACT